MNILITGSRTGISRSQVEDVLNKEITSGDTIITGGAIGVDTYTIDWCKKTNIPYKVIVPKNKDIKLNYLFRDCVMIGMCSKVIALWDGKSPGTKFTYEYAIYYGLKGYLRIFNENKTLDNYGGK